MFVHRGQPIGRRYLFEDALETACTRAGLVDANGKPTVTAHRFRHTVGAQLAEGGARIQTIMAILDHRSAGMAVTYSTSAIRYSRSSTSVSSQTAEESLARPRKRCSTTRSARRPWIG
ncbi:MAG TPA: tyrosine-type recombinase/integrase [Mycobacterium sp.]|nr:tyrosine-type recombinase/integrase [Mycobacterium sp.]